MYRSSHDLLNRGATLGSLVFKDKGPPAKPSPSNELRPGYTRRLSRHDLYPMSLGLRSGNGQKIKLFHKARLLTLPVG